MNEAISIKEFNDYVKDKYTLDNLIKESKDVNIYCTKYKIPSSIVKNLDTSNSIIKQLGIEKYDYKLCIYEYTNNRKHIICLVLNCKLREFKAKIKLKVFQ